MNENRQLAVFRVKVADILSNHADKMKIFVTENVAIGMSQDSIRAMRQNPLSRWAMEREALIKTVKREVAGLVNKVCIVAYTKEL